MTDTHLESLRIGEAEPPESFTEVLSSTGFLEAAQALPHLRPRDTPIFISKLTRAVGQRADKSAYNASKLREAELASLIDDPQYRSKLTIWYGHNYLDMFFGLLGQTGLGDLIKSRVGPYRMNLQDGFPLFKLGDGEDGETLTQTVVEQTRIAQKSRELSLASTGYEDALAGAKQNMHEEAATIKSSVENVQVSVDGVVSSLAAIERIPHTEFEDKYKNITSIPTISEITSLDQATKLVSELFDPESGSYYSLEPSAASELLNKFTMHVPFIKDLPKNALDMLYLAALAPNIAL